MGDLKIRHHYARAIYSLPFFIIHRELTFMAQSFLLDSKPRGRKVSRLFLAFFWVCGILFGVWICCLAGGPFLSAMRSALFRPVSIIGLLLTATLPFLLSALAVFISGSAWLLPLSFLSGFMHGAVSFAAYLSFGFAGWLLRPLLCFSAWATAPAAYWFWLRHISGSQRLSLGEACCFLSFAALIGSLDHSYISPFLAKLISR